jgi:hypothetical protein
MSAASSKDAADSSRILRRGSSEGGWKEMWRRYWTWI